MSAVHNKIGFMCGRFALAHPPAILQEWYSAAFMPAFSAHYNIAPGSNIVAVRSTEEGCSGTLMRWGFIPAWAKDPGTMPMLHNARGETVAKKPMFRQAFRRRRCLIPASGFYEWKQVPDQKSRQPFYISYKDGSPMSFAGFWETSRAEDGTRIDTCIIITTNANEVLEPIYHRMPVVLEREAWDTWLSPEPVTDELLMELIAPSGAEKMQAWGVAHAVNKIANDSPALLYPIAET